MPFFTQTLTYGSKTSQNHPQQLLKKKKKKKLYIFFHNQNTFFTEQKHQKEKIWKIIETGKSTLKHCSVKKKGTPEKEILENKPLFSWVMMEMEMKWELDSRRIKCSA